MPLLPAALQYLLAALTCLFALLLLSANRRLRRTAALNGERLEQARQAWLASQRDQFVTRTYHSLRWPVDYAYHFYDHYVAGQADEEVVACSMPRYRMN